MKKTNFKKLGLILMMVLLIFTLTACGNNTGTKENAKETTYPLEYTDSFDYTMSISARPERIISLTPNITEVLCSLGLEDKLVGRTDYCDYPESVVSIASIGDITTPNMEKIVELKPDVVITDGMQTKEFGDSLRNLGITLIVLRENQTMEGTYKILENAGLITDTMQKANDLVTSMKAELEKVDNKIKDVEKKTVFYAVDFGDYGIYTAGAGTYIDELFTRAGLVNVAQDSEGWTYSLEKLYENDPDIIICSEFYGTKDRLLSYSPFQDLKAVKSGNIVEIDNNMLDRQSARNVDAIKELVKAIYNVGI